jgi:hypothetical protein
MGMMNIYCKGIILPVGLYKYKLDSHSKAEGNLQSDVLK